MIDKFLFIPLELWSVGQKFGQNEACVDTATTTKVISCNGLTPPVGYRSIYGSGGHSGLDCYAGHGQKLFNACDGTVRELVNEQARGKGLGIVTDVKRFCIETGKPEYFVVRYWHLLDFNVKPGDFVRVGTQIGLCDNTGYSAGDHLHFEVKPVAQNSKGEWYNILQDNGTYGAIDPIPYMDEMTAVEFRKREDAFKQAQELAKIPGMGPTVIKVLQQLLSLFTQARKQT